MYCRSCSLFAPIAAVVLTIVLMNVRAGATVAGAFAPPTADPSGDSAASFVADTDGERPAIVPLPPALGTGLVGLGTMAVLRVGRRVYRRR
jgi:hypothetical protein